MKSYKLSWTHTISFQHVSPDFGDDFRDICAYFCTDVNGNHTLKSQMVQKFLKRCGTANTSHWLGQCHWHQLPIWHVKSHQCEPGLKVLSCVRLPPVASLLSRSWETQRPWRPGVSQMQVLQFRNLANAPYAYLLTDKRPMWKISAQFAEGFPAKVESFSHLLHKINGEQRAVASLLLKNLDMPTMVWLSHSQDGVNSNPANKGFLETV